MKRTEHSLFKHSLWISGITATAVMLAAGLLAAAPLQGKTQEAMANKPAAENKQDKLEEKVKTFGPYELIVPLNDLWYVQSSDKVKASGAELSKPGVSIENWYPALVPSTVLGTLVQNNVHSDLFKGLNLKAVAKEPFQVSWWYRREFSVPSGRDITHYALELDGVNYRANVWVNGSLAADSSSVFGAFRRFSLDVTKFIKTGEKNVLAVEVIPPRPGEPAIGFVDWNPAPPDAAMGLWREARIRACGDVAVDNVFVRTKLDLKTLAEARLTVSADLRNLGGVKRRVGVKINLNTSTVGFEQSVTLLPGEKKTVVFTPDEHPELVVREPRVWWTCDLGSPELNKLYVAVKADGRLSDLTSIRFGIREVSDYLTDDGRRGYMLNGRKILIRGAGWTDDMLLSANKKRLAAEIAYVRQMRLNALRLEGFWGTSQGLYDLCDENGILVMAGWSCHWEWEGRLGKPVDEKYGGIVSPEDMALISQSWEDQIVWLRNHPSILVWLMASDKLPKPELEREFRGILQEKDPTRPTLASAKGLTSPVSGPTGVKMAGPYDYVPPAYWYSDTANGGAFGFDTEVSPGPQVPPVESLKKMLPEKDLWPFNETWAFHCCDGKFRDLARFNEALDKRLGPAKDVEDYARKAQFLNYEGMRAMYEAFTVNAGAKGRATGVIQWMLNSAWPKLWWQLYDYYLMPNAAFYAARKACSPMGIIYDYATKEIVAVNDTQADANELRAEVRLYDPDMKPLSAKTISVQLAAGERKVIDAPIVPSYLTSVYFLDLRMFNGRKPAASNFYVLPVKPDVLDGAGTDWFVTPVKQYADYSALAGLKPVKVESSARFRSGDPRTSFTVELANKGQGLAFQIEIQVVRASTGTTVVPIILEDNYINLLPGEKRKISGWFATEDLEGDEPKLLIKGWNLEPDDPK